MVNITTVEEFERNRKAVMELPDIAYEVNSDYRRVTILSDDSLIHGPYQETTEVKLIDDPCEIPFGVRVPRVGE